MEAPRGPHSVTARKGPDAARVARALAQWFSLQARDLPWRRTGDPYHILLSEFLLQQTRMEVGRRYFDAFVARFPRIEDLAGAPLEEVQRLWSGLGYYRRARNLHAAAQRILAEHGGRVPDDPAILQTLPGIGPYTAGAIASIAYGRPEPSLDGNQLRVYGRVLGLRSGNRARIDTFARELLARGRPGDLNQALMDLGSGVCRPTRPDCGSCPIAAACASRGKAFTRAKVLTRSKARVEDRDVLLHVRAGRLWLEAPKADGLLAGVWLPPMRSAGSRAWKPHAVHVFSHRTWRVRWTKPKTRPGDGGRWVSVEELPTIAHGALTKMAFRAAGLTSSP